MDIRRYPLYLRLFHPVLFVREHHRGSVLTAYVVSGYDAATLQTAAAMPVYPARPRRCDGPLAAELAPLKAALKTDLLPSHANRTGRRVNILQRDFQSLI